MPPMTRGPLPPAVYWRRRAVVIGGALLLLVLLVRVLHHGGGDSAAGADTARQTSGHPGTAASPTDSPATDSSTRHRTHRHHASGGTGNDTGTGPSESPTTPATTGPAQGPTQPVLAAPTGPCQDNDVVVTPAAITGTAGGTVDLALGLRTRTEAACTWKVTYRSLAVSVVHHGETVWSSGQCPQQLPSTSIVVRRDVATSLTVPWDGRTSEAGCPRATAFAQPGKYRVSGASIGGLPAGAHIVLVAPTAAPSSTPTASSSPTSSPTSSPSESPSAGSVPVKRHRTMKVR